VPSLKNIKDAQQISLAKAKSERELGQHLTEKPICKVSVLKPITARIDYSFDLKIKE